MSAQAQYEAKQLVSLARNISSSAKFVQHDLLILIENTAQIKDVAPDLTEFTDPALTELQRARGLIAESLEIANNLYQTGLDTLKGGE
ncbi:MAG: hypothetical protein GQ532_16390 [Methylomarinum sp.]|nr:hypothetical protein [Methylomarinum sp.]